MTNILQTYTQALTARTVRVNKDSYPAGSPSREEDVAGLCLWHKPAELAHSFSFCSCVCFCGGDVAVYVFDINQPSFPTPFYSVLVSVSVLMAFSTVFCSINSLNNSPFSHSYLSGLVSALLVLSTIYLYREVFPQRWFNPLWLTGLKAPTNQLWITLILTWSFFGPTFWLEPIGCKITVITSMSVASDWGQVMCDVNLGTPPPLPPPPFALRKQWGIFWMHRAINW